MWSQLFILLRAVPVTWLMLFAAALILGADNALVWKYQIPFHDAQLALGTEDQFRLWEGAWWTVLTTGFHHGGFLHLLCNASFLWWMGRLLETRLGSWRYAIFCLSGLVVSGTIQSLWGSYVGLSGMLCAQLGLVWAWRRTDTWLQTYVQQEQIQSGLGFLLLCIPLAWLNILPVANIAHFSGLFYGFIAGQVFFGSRTARQWKPVFLVSHAILIPLFYFLVHPVWNGNYHWRRGDVATIPAERLQHYENAVLWNPNLSGPWLNLALISHEEGNIAGAWKWILQGLRHHPGYQKAIELARLLWEEFPNRREQLAARQQLREIFGDEAPQWERTLNIDALDAPPAARQKKLVTKPPAVLEDAETIHAPEPPFTLPRRALDEIPRPAEKVPAPNPNAPGSAEEGRAA